MYFRWNLLKAATGANEPDRADRHQPFSFRELGGEAGVVGATAAATHLER